jgi:hypothetical protein
MHDGACVPRRGSQRGRTTQGEEPDWGPLLDAVGRYVVSDFMWMFEVELSDGTRLQAYKHIDTRRYVHLAADGATFAFNPPDRYDPVSKTDAFRAVFAGLPRLAGVTDDQLAVTRAAVDRLYTT